MKYINIKKKKYLILARDSDNSVVLLDENTVCIIDNKRIYVNSYLDKRYSIYKYIYIRGVGMFLSLLKYNSHYIYLRSNGTLGVVSERYLDFNDALTNNFNLLIEDK